MKKKVFISGPMTGYENYNIDAFIAAERMLTDLGYSVFNPAWMKFDENWQHDEIMAIDIQALSKCDMIYQLEGWESSKGALEEYQYAAAHRIAILKVTTNFYSFIDPPESNAMDISFLKHEIVENILKMASSGNTDEVHAYHKSINVVKDKFGVFLNEV